MKGLKMSEVRGWSVEELKKKIKETSQALFQSKMKHARRQLENPMALRTAKREIAKMMTVLKSREKDGGK